jgi:LmbE family N-acetylglucosaminyl deacetylase
MSILPSITDSYVVGIPRGYYLLKRPTLVKLGCDIQYALPSLEKIITRLRMSRIRQGVVGLLIAALLVAAQSRAQSPVVIHGADERYKVDILVVVAHPDDEAGFTPYLARAIYDQHKRVAVVFGTHGGSGGNSIGREHGAALANIREIEARQACAKLGITNVWFLDGKDTASQDVLNSLASWGHGENLEKLVGLIRLTRPEVLMTNLPSVFIGENHGDHQAAGILTTEAFDLSGNPVAFPAQLAGDMRRNDTFLENLQPWQAKKLYYSDDTQDSEKFPITGPSYSVKEVSPSQKKPYWRIALEAAMPHLTQFPEEIQRVAKMSDADLEKLMSDPHSAWWAEPFMFILGKSVVSGKPTDDVFAHVDEAPIESATMAHQSCEEDVSKNTSATLPHVELGGPWLYFREFRNAHGLCTIPVAQVPEIGIKSGSTVSVPVTVFHDPSKSLELTVSAKAPEGWKIKSGAGKLSLPAESITNFRVDIDTPTLTSDDLKNSKLHDVMVEVQADGKTIGELTLRVKLGATGLPQ